MDPIEGYVGNARYFTFRLRRRGEATNWDVAGATSVALEWHDAATGEVRDDVEADPEAPGADWADGLVVFYLSSSNVFAEAGTFDAVIAVVTGSDEEFTVPEDGPFRVVVRPRPQP